MIIFVLALILFECFTRSLADAPSSQTVVSALSIIPSSTSNKPTRTSATPTTTHTVSVGKGDHKMDPDTTTANIGDTIEFQFYPQNHSVVRAEYGYPCIPYEMTGDNKTGFWSGFHPVDTISDNPPKFRITINTSDPIFFYCSAPGSCITYGMVGVINPNSSTVLSTQRALALNSSYALSPGESFPAESPSASSTLSATSTNTAGPVPSSSSKKLGPGPIAGIVIGGVTVIALGALLFFFIGRSRTLEAEVSRKDSTIRRTDPPSPSFFISHGSPRDTMHVADSYFPGSESFASPNGYQSGTFSPGGTPIPYPMPAHSPVQHHPTRSSSQATRRSVGGTFGLSPTTGCYTRTHDGEDVYKYNSPASGSRDVAGADAESPVLGRSGSNPKPKVMKFLSFRRKREKGNDSAVARPLPVAVNEGFPAEMDGGDASGVGWNAQHHYIYS